MRPRRRGALRYAVAVLLALAAFPLTRILAPIVGPETVVWYLAAVALSAFYGGLGPGLLTTLASALLANYYDMPPVGFSPPTETEIVRTVTFVIVAALMTTLSDRLIQAWTTAEQASAAKSRLLSVIGHELRTPLGAIGGYLDLLEMELRGPLTEQQREDLTRIRRNQQYLLTLVSDALQLERVETGRVEYHIADVPVAELLAGIEPLVAPQLRAGSLAFSREGCEDGVLCARADREKVEQIVINLVTNAIKYTEPGGTIRVSCGAEGAAVCVRVADTGIGIPADKLEAIFEPFMQAGQTIAGRRQGVGLGLAISRDLARGMGGELTARSAPGAGSVFTLRLPRAESTQARVDQSSP